MKSKKRSELSNHLYEMAKKLNLERRLHPRAKFPLNDWKDFSGPKFIYKDQILSVLDLSEGGACVSDEGGHLQLKSGEEFELTLFCGENHDVRCRLVAMNLNRRHLQFVDPQADLKKSLRLWIQKGLRAVWMKAVDRSQLSSHPILWSSIYDDSLTLSLDPRWTYNFMVDEEIIHLSEDFWPVISSDLKPIGVEEFDHLLIFLENLTFADEHSKRLKDFLYGIRRRSFE